MNFVSPVTSLAILLLSLYAVISSVQGFVVPVLWPQGTYGLPMADTGCPGDPNFTWRTGYRYQDMEDDTKNSQLSASSHLAANVHDGDVEQNFCMKTSTASDNSRPLWPKGDYCIYKRGKTCPSHSSTKCFEGYFYWDDENGKRGVNKNKKSGALPFGFYDVDTEIRFCCDVSGFYKKPIELPIDKPFYLFPFNKLECQEVYGAFHSLEYIRYDTEKTGANYNRRDWPYPYALGELIERKPTLYYCHYQACRFLLSGVRGTFASPYYPANYMNYADCEWRVTVPVNHVIQFNFSEVHIYQCLGTSDPCCDYISVAELPDKGATKSNVTKYCQHPFVLRTKTNSAVVKFRSNSVNSDKGFNATFLAVPLQGKTTPVYQTNSEPFSRNDTSSSFPPTTVKTSHETTTAVFSTTTQTATSQTDLSSQSTGVTVIISSKSYSSPRSDEHNTEITTTSASEADTSSQSTDRRTHPTTISGAHTAETVTTDYLSSSPNVMSETNSSAQLAGVSTGTVVVISCVAVLALGGLFLAVFCYRRRGCGRGKSNNNNNNKHSLFWVDWSVKFNARTSATSLCESPTSRRSIANMYGELNRVATGVDSELDIECKDETTCGLHIFANEEIDKNVESGMNKIGSIVFEQSDHPVNLSLLKNREVRKSENPIYEESETHMLKSENVLYESLENVMERTQQTENIMYDSPRLETEKTRQTDETLYDRPRNIPEKAQQSEGSMYGR